MRSLSTDSTVHRSYRWWSLPCEGKTVQSFAQLLAKMREGRNVTKDPSERSVNILLYYYYYHYIILYYIIIFYIILYYIIYNNYIYENVTMYVYVCEMCPSWMIVDDYWWSCCARCPVMVVLLLGSWGFEPVIVASEIRVSFKRWTELITETSQSYLGFWWFLSAHGTPSWLSWGWRPIEACHTYRFASYTVVHRLIWAASWWCWCKNEATMGPLQQIHEVSPCCR